MTRRRKTMKGGFWESLSSAWNTTKKASSDAYNSASSSVTTPTPSPASTPAPAPTYTSAPSPSPTPTPLYTPVQGGRKRRRRTFKRGGYSANTSISNLASSSASFSGKTAQPHTWVGGNTRRRRHSHTKSCKHKRHRKH